VQPGAATARRTRSPLARGEVTAAFAIATAIAALFAFDAWHHGALGAARNDDWAYYRVVFTFADTGVFRLDGWPQMSFVGQAVGALPVVAAFGHSIAALQVTVALVGALGVGACYCILRRFLFPAMASLACATLVVGPVFGSLSVSFMTDVPAFSLQAVTLLIGLKALERPRVSLPLLLFAATTGVLAVSIREYAAVAIGAVLALAFVKAVLAHERDTARRVVAVAVTVAVVAGAIMLWRRSLPHDVPTALDGSADHLGAALRWTLPRAVLTLAAFVAPMAFVVSPARLARRSWRASRSCTVGACAAGAAFIVTTGGQPFLGNYFTPYGSYPIAIAGSAPRLVAPAPWALITLAAVYSLVVALWTTTVTWTERRATSLTAVASLRAGIERDPAGLLVVAFCASVAVLSVGVVAVTSAPFADRYLVVLVPFAGGLFLRAVDRYDLARRNWRLVAGATLVAFACVGFVFVDAAATVDGAAWHTSRRVEALGVAPEAIDGGLAWFGFHQSVAADPGSSRPATTWWAALFPDQQVCATVEYGPTRRPALVRYRARTVFGRAIELVGVAGPDRGTCPQR